MGLLSSCVFTVSTLFDERVRSIDLDHAKQPSVLHLFPEGGTSTYTHELQPEPGPSVLPGS